jgi:endonuclease/exonuclease/phosphatase (EEP) superfamily protein YafD
MTTPVQPETQGARARVWRRAFAVAALGAVGAPLAVALAGLSGVGHRWIDILAQFTAPAVVATALLASGFMILRRGRWAAAAGAVLALLVTAVWPQWFPVRGTAEAGASPVRLYSANLWARNTDVDAITASVQAADADIVVLIELGDAPAGRLDEVLAGYPHRVATPRIDRPSGPARSVIASRYPLVAIRDRPDGLHAVGATVRSPLGRLNVIGVHLTRPWPFREQWGQIEQTMALAAIREDLSGPVVVVGDFNSVSSARIGRQVRREAGLIPAPGFPGTWPSALPSAIGVTIDQVYRSPDLALVSRKLGRPNGSDHRPVVTGITRAAN